MKTRAEVMAILQGGLNPEVVRIHPEMRVPYLPWNLASEELSRLLPENPWSWHIIRAWTEMALRGGRDNRQELAIAYVHGRLSIQCSDGVLDMERLAGDDQPTGQRGLPYERAEAACFRRCAAMLGQAMGLGLYRKDGPNEGLGGGPSGGSGTFGSPSKQPAF